MDCEVLVSVMNQKTQDEIIKRLGVSDADKTTIINQVTDKLKPEVDVKNGNHKFFSYHEKGLSKSRNHALKSAVGDICLIADDDMRYVDDFKKKVVSAYEKYPEADLIAFIVDREGKKFVPKIKKEGRINGLMTMKLSSVQLSFRRESIIDSGISFDEEFGAGAKYPWGEENIFLFDCLRKGLKIYYVPAKIATLLDIDKTSWDKSNTPEHYEKQGAIYYRMSPKMWRVLALQFVLRKRTIFSNDMSGIKVYKSMVWGAKAYKKECSNEK